MFCMVLIVNENNNELIFNSKLMVDGVEMFLDTHKTIYNVPKIIDLEYILHIEDNAQYGKIFFLGQP